QQQQYRQQHTGSSSTAAVVQQQQYRQQQYRQQQYRQQHTGSSSTGSSSTGRGGFWIMSFFNCQVQTEVRFQMSMRLKFWDGEFWNSHKDGRGRLNQGDSLSHFSKVNAVFKFC
ncbi:mCG1040587, partial [Mus musculus]